MRYLVLLVLVGCAAPSRFVVQKCSSGKVVQVTRPTIKNAPLNKTVLNNRLREACRE